jgi:hypothetical protein
VIVTGYFRKFMWSVIGESFEGIDTSSRKLLGGKIPK